MMRRGLLVTVIRLLPCLLVLSLGEGNVNAQSSNGPTTAFIIKIIPERPAGRFKVIQGKNHSVNARVNMAVRRGDLLILDAETQASIACRGVNGEIVTVPLKPGRQGSPCTEPCPPEICGIEYNGSMIKVPRGKDTSNAQYPIVLSPRATLLRNLRPEIRWAPIASAKSVTYRVTIFGENMQAIWSRDVDSETTLAYPETEPPLARGRTYKVIVTAQGRSSDEEGGAGLGFETVTAEQARELDHEAQKRKSLGLSEPQTRVLIANLYAGRELYAYPSKALYAEAIEQLCRAYDIVKDPVIARKLADLYLLIGLPREAEKKYLEALEVLDPEDLEETGLTQEHLATAYEQLGIFDHALRRLDEAIKAYEQLGDSAAVEELKKRQQRLKKNN